MAAGINITDRAAEKIKQLLAAEKREGQGLPLRLWEAVARASRTKWILMHRVPEIKSLRRTRLKSWWI